jgi:hypothetical protein
MERIEYEVELELTDGPARHTLSRIVTTLSPLVIDAIAAHRPMD